MKEWFVDDQRMSSITFVTGDSAERLHLAKRDEEIHSLVCEALGASGYEQLRMLQVYCHNGRVTLQGRVTTSYIKRAAKSIVLAVPGVRDIDNDLSVFTHR